MIDVQIHIMKNSVAAVEEIQVYWSIVVTTNKCHWKTNLHSLQGQGEENNEVKEKVPDTKVNKKEQEQQIREQERLRKEKKMQKDRAKQVN